MLGRGFLGIAGMPSKLWLNAVLKIGLRGLAVHRAATPPVRNCLSLTRITALDGFAKKLSSRVRAGLWAFA